MDNFIKENERLEDLGIKGLKIIQNPDYFCFGIDAVPVSYTHLRFRRVEV